MEDDERDALIIYFVSYALLNYLVHKGIHTLGDFISSFGKPSEDSDIEIESPDEEGAEVRPARRSKTRGKGSAPSSKAGIPTSKGSVVSVKSVKVTERGSIKATRGSVQVEAEVTRSVRSSRVEANVSPSIRGSRVEASVPPSIRGSRVEANVPSSRGSRAEVNVPSIRGSRVEANVPPSIRGSRVEEGPLVASEGEDKIQLQPKDRSKHIDIGEKRSKETVCASLKSKKSVHVCASVKSVESKKIASAKASQSTVCASLGGVSHATTSKGTSHAHLTVGFSRGPSGTSQGVSQSTAASYNATTTSTYTTGGVSQRTSKTICGASGTASVATTSKGRTYDSRTTSEIRQRASNQDRYGYDTGDKVCAASDVICGALEEASYRKDVSDTSVADAPCGAQEDVCDARSQTTRKGPSDLPPCAIPKPKSRRQGG